MHACQFIRLAEKSQKKCHDLVDPKDFIVLQKFALDEKCGHLSTFINT